jgi:hypothetical protein
MSETNLTPSPGAPEGWPYEENRVRHRMGLTKDEMRALRQEKLTPFTDFTVYKKRVWLSAAASSRLLGMAGAKVKKTRGRTTAEDGSPVKKPPPEIVTLRVVRCDLRNPHLLLACPADQDPDRPKTTLRVRVRSAENFARRMELPAVLVDGHTDLFDLAHGLPRKKGKW